jgi:hypothetical protein
MAQVVGPKNSTDSLVHTAGTLCKTVRLFFLSPLLGFKEDGIWVVTVSHVKRFHGDSRVSLVFISLYFCERGGGRTGSATLLDGFDRCGGRKGRWM